MKKLTVVTVAVDHYQDGAAVRSALGAWSTKDPDLTDDDDPSHLLDAIRSWLGIHYIPASVEDVQRAWEQRSAAPPWDQLELF